MQTIFYGERGIVNGLVLDIQNNMSRAKSVLKAIDWCSPGDHHWIGQIEDITFFVEPGFDKFGQPDLMILCELKDKSRRCIIIEAKACPYHASSKSNSKGMVQTGFNSSINGQISLNYRFALALMHCKKKKTSVVESPDIFACYKEQLSETYQQARRLGKSLTLDLIVDPHLRGLNVKDVFFVAMTRDIGKNPITHAPEEYKPLLLDQSGQDCWQVFAPQIGFLSLEKLDTKTLKLDGYFRAGCRMHIGDWTMDKIMDCGGAPEFRTLNWNKYLDSTVEATDRMAGCIREQIHPWSISRKYNGSYSFIVNGRTVGKLALDDPKDPMIMVGFSNVEPRAQYFASKLGKPECRLIGTQKRPFLMVKMTSVREEDEVVDVMSAFLEHVR